MPLLAGPACRAAAALCTVFLAFAFPSPRECVADEPLPLYRQVLPATPVTSLPRGGKVMLAPALHGRPAVILVTEENGGPACALSQTIGEDQADLAPWFTWAVVLSGPGDPARLDDVLAGWPVRFEARFHDPEGDLRSALGLEKLPALIVVNEDGFIYLVCSTAATEVATVLGDGLEGMLAGARRKQRGFLDFSLPALGGGMVSFLEVARRDFTLLAFLHSRCRPCAVELQVLERVRDANPGRIGFAAVFLDDPGEGRIEAFLEAATVRPDHVLLDPRLALAGRYGVRRVPDFLVLDRTGEIIFSRRGFREEDRLPLLADLEELLRVHDREAASSAPAPAPLQESGRIFVEARSFLEEGKAEMALFYLERVRELLPSCHTVHRAIAEAALAAGRPEEALRSFARYLAAEPQAYDAELIRGRMAALLAERK